MTPDLRVQYEAAVDGLESGLAELGFRRQAREKFVRSKGDAVQRLTTSLLKLRGTSEARVEVFPGFDFRQVELLAATLQGKKPRPGFVTASANIGLLAPEGRRLDWSLTPAADAAAIAHQILQLVHAVAVPFWDEFLSVPMLLSRFDARDPRICWGSEWTWQHIAACCLVKKRDRAMKLLEEKLAIAPAPLEPVINEAIRRVADIAKWL